MWDYVLHTSTHTPTHTYTHTYTHQTHSHTHTFTHTSTLTYPHTHRVMLSSHFSIAAPKFRSACRPFRWVPVGFAYSGLLRPQLDSDVLKWSSVLTEKDGCVSAHCKEDGGWICVLRDTTKTHTTPHHTPHHTTHTTPYKHHTHTNTTHTQTPHTHKHHTHTNTTHTQTPHAHTQTPHTHKHHTHTQTTHTHTHTWRRCLFLKVY